MKWLTLLLFLVLPLPVLASHAWSYVDICKMYEDTLPPGLSAESLPAAKTQGARLLASYCTQCHNLPGPDRHTAAEWREVTSRMFMLMDVSSLFGGLMGRVNKLSQRDQGVVLDYLERHAADPDTGKNLTALDLRERPWLTRTLALLPVMLLTGLGLLRCWRSSRKATRCALNAG